MNQIHQPIALITGASRGLGRSAAQALAIRGTDLIITYQRDEQAAHSVVNSTRALGRRAVAIQLDLLATETFDNFAKRVDEVLSHSWQRTSFDYLVNNAGSGHFASIAQTDEKLLDEMFGILLKGPFLLTRILASRLRDGGRIINVSSGASRFAMQGMAAYAVMKGGLDTLTLYLAKEFGTRCITVNTVAPGPVVSDFGHGMLRENAALQAFLAGQTALGRVGMPDDIGDAIACLLAEGNRWVNGQRIDVSGGIGL